MTPDQGNALFEFFGAIFSWRNAWQLLTDKQIRGVYWPAWLFFTSWGVWNIYYYRAIEQPYSFAAGLLLVSGNVFWCILAWRYRKS